MGKKQLKSYIKNNSALILEYINKEILKDIGELHFNFFIRLFDEYFEKEEKRVLAQDITIDTFIYYLIVEILGDAKQAFPFFRKDTLSLDKIFSEAKVYFNHVRFTIEEGAFIISLVQTKAGVSTLDEEIIKFSKKIPMKTSGFDEFI